MALAQDGIDPQTARAAIAELIREEFDLPPVAQLLAHCRAARLVDIEEIHCPNCGSILIAVDDGAGLCFDCDWQGALG